MNLIISLWEMMYETGGMNDTQVRVVSRRLFSGEVGEWYWRTSRANRLRVATDRRLRRFIELLDEEYEKAARPPPAPEPAAPKPDAPAPPRQEPPGEKAPKQPHDG